MQEAKNDTAKPLKELQADWKQLQAEWKRFCITQKLNDVLLIKFGENYDVAGYGNEYRSIGFNALYYKSRKTLDHYLLFRKFGKPFTPKTSNSSQSLNLTCYPYGSLSELITFAAQNLTTSALGNTPFDDAFLLFKKIEQDLQAIDLKAYDTKRLKKNLKRLHSLLSNPDYSLANYEEYVKHIMPKPLPNATRFALYWKDTRHENMYSELIQHLLGDAILLASLFEKVKLSSDEIIRVYLSLRETLPITNWKKALQKGASNEEVTQILFEMIRATIKLIRGGDSFTSEDKEKILTKLEKEKLFTRYNYNVAKIPRFFLKSLHVVVFSFTDASEDAFFSEETVILLITPQNISQLAIEEIHRFLEKHLELFKESDLYTMQYYAGPFELMDQLEEKLL